MDAVYQLYAIVGVPTAMGAAVAFRMQYLEMTLPYVARSCDWDKSAQELREEMWAESDLLRTAAIILCSFAFLAGVAFVAVNADRFV